MSYPWGRSEGLDGGTATACTHEAVPATVRPTLRHEYSRAVEVVDQSAQEGLEALHGSEPRRERLALRALAYRDQCLCLPLHDVNCSVWYRA